ncbi:MAG: 8-amino-7-oxononanoate synthase [Actinobacteria bacterium 13_1_20CM_3_68_9]|nr:MAG: 8-amino-7-oxononanoate synthase [Actinobacteria bacterium 13_1_20CM_3_68_9]
MSDVADRLEDLRRAGLHRRLRLIESPQGPRVTLDGAEVLLLCSNNYLGLADHPRVRQAAADAAERFGAGAGASRLVSGNMSVHGKLEQRLAAFSGSEAALLFGSGYLANLGAIAVLAGRGQVVFSDELNHASIVDGCRISRAERFIYRHGDLEHLSWGLRKEGRGGGLIVTDAVFSMDGDVAPIAELLEIARRHGCRLMVDEAHATGALGPGGRGAVAEAGLSGEVDVIIGTLGKALGSYGAYVCGGGKLIDLLINTARPFIFSTALPPPAIGAALAALTILDGQPGLVEHLRRNGAILRDALADNGLEVGASRTQIVPVVVGEARRTMALCERALEGRVFAQGIRPPTVPEGTSRLRLSVMANHRADELCAAAGVIGQAAQELDVVPRGTEQRVSAASRLLRAA